MTVLSRIVVGCLGVALSATLARSGLHWDQEMALFPWLMRHGWTLYRDLRDQHAPLLPFVLSLLPNPGAPGPQLVFTIAVIAITLVLIARIAWRLSGPVAMVAATTLYALWVMPFEGAHLWYDLALAPLYAAALLIALGPRDAPVPPTRILAVGAVLGVAVLVKQQAAIALVAGVAICWPWTWRRVGLYVVGAVVPLAISVGAFLAAGALRDYVYWTAIYNLTSSYVREGAAAVPLTDWPILVAVYAPAAAWMIGRSHREMPRVVFGAGLVLAATLPAWPRYARFHLAAALPLLAILFGVAVSNVTRLRVNGAARRRARHVVAASIAVLAFTAATAVGGHRIMRVWRAVPAPPPFDSSVDRLQAWIATAARPDDPIVVYALDSCLYRVLDRQPTKPWTPVYSWILEGRSTAAEWEAGMARVRPPVALVPVEFVENRWLPDIDGGRAASFLRANYAVGPRFTMQKYPGSAPQEIAVMTLIPRKPNP